MASRTAIQGCADACTACPRLVLADEEPDTFTGLTGFLIERALRFAGGGVMAEFQEDENHQYLTMAAPAAIAEWMLHDVWDAETACQLVVLGYKLPRPTWKFLKELDALDALDLLDLPAVLNKLRERHACDASDEQQIQDTLDAMDSLDVRDIRDDLRWLGMLVEKGAVNIQFVRTICAVNDRAKAIADSSVNAGTICEHDTPENWRRWAQGKGYSVAHLMLTDALAAKVEAGAVISPSGGDTSLNTANLVYWRVILYSNIKKIDEHKKANVRGIIKYLRGLKDKRILNKGGHEELLWIDDNNNE